MTLLGFLLIAAGWFIQYRSGSQSLEKSFLVLYISGTVFFIFDNLSFERLLIGLLNVIILVFIFFIMKQKSPRSKARRRR